MSVLDGSNLQRQVGLWAEQTFPGATHSSIMAHLAREVAELSAALLAGGGQPDVKRVSEEAADCYLILLHIAHRNGFTLGEAGWRKLAVNKTRTWGGSDAEGVREHVRDNAKPEPVLERCYWCREFKPISRLSDVPWPDHANTKRVCDECIDDSA